MKRISDLSTEIGQTYLDTLRNRYSGAPLSNARRKRFRGAVCTFNRYLVDVGILEADPFAGINLRDD